VGVFRLFGFRVEIRPGFLLFLVLVVLLYGGSQGLWAAGSIAVFTLIHELGHATAARATGSHAEISLDFLAGYASYVPRRPLTRWERAGIAVAGATAQFTSAVVVLLLLGANPFSRADIAANDATISIWWAGIALAVVNLIPILPLDGGSILGIFVEWLSPTRGRSAMLWFSVAVSSIGVASAIVMPVLQGFLPFAAVLLVLQVQMLRAERSVEGMRARLTPLAFIAALQDAGAHEAAAGEAAKLFRSTPSAELAARVSISLSASGDHDGAQAWMRLAEQMTLVRRD
jgi:Zn-dependent protease